jgi:pimeloyl-ACP methyl ester carboxylesterase
VPLTYLQDMEALLAELKLERFILFGTSLGGLITMLMAATGRERIAGALLNDIGPVIEARGLERIRSYVGRSQNWPTWLHAARFLAEAQQDRYPDWEIDDWLVYAKRLCRLTSGGRIVFDYDMRIAEPFKLPQGEAGFDLWPAFRALAGIPSLVVHGELSDVLSAESVKKMTTELPTMESATVPRVGHAPTLDEPEAQKAIDKLLKRVAASAESSRRKPGPMNSE